MSKLYSLILAILALPAAAGTSAVTATVTDSDSQTWNNGTFQVTFVPVQGTPASSYNVNGASFTQSFSGSMNGSGVLTVTLTDLATISPSGGQWRFNLCPNASGVCGSVITNAVTGATPNLSSQLSSGLSGPRFSAGPSAYGYLDAEVSPTPQPGGQYFNVTSAVLRVWNGSAWVNGGGGGTTAFSTLSGGTNTTAAMTVGTGASMGYSGTGALNSSNSPYLLTAFPVTAYGAKCDGSTNDLTAIQNAENAAESAGGGAVIFPGGQCNYAGTLTIQANYIHWVGQSEVRTVLMETSAGSDFLDLTGSSPSAPILRGSIQDITFQRSGAFTGSPSGLKFTNVQLWDTYRTEVTDSFADINLVGAANLLFKRVNVLSNLSVVTHGFLVQTADSTYIEDSISAAVGNSITNAMSITNAAADLWVERFNVGANGGDVVLTGSAGNPATQDVHFISPILEPGSSGAALQITSTNGNNCGLSTPCQVTVVDPHIANNGGPDVVLTNAQGVNIIGGDIRCRVATNCVQVTGALSTNDTFNGNWFRSQFSGASPTSFLQVSSAGKNISVINNQFFGTSSFPFTTGIAVTGTSGGNYSNNSLSGNGTTALSFDSTSTSNTISQLNVNTTSITTPISDAGAGNTYIASTLAPGIIGNAVSYKSTASITGAVPVKWDTSNANQVVQTATGDTGSGIAIGVCANSPGAASACLVMNGGTVPLTLGTGTCAIGNFVIVDTTTNGDIKCTGSYSAGTVIGTAQAANSSTGTTSNVMIGLR
jgi:hypothetical protein